MRAQAWQRLSFAERLVLRRLRAAPRGLNLERKRISNDAVGEGMHDLTVHALQVDPCPLPSCPLARALALSIASRFCRVPPAVARG